MTLNARSLRAAQMPSGMPIRMDRPSAVRTMDTVIIVASQIPMTPQKTSDPATTSARRTPPSCQAKRPKTAIRTVGGVAVKRTANPCST